MPSIASLIERSAPLTPESLGVDAFRRFERDPDALLLPVVEEGRPVGVVERYAFLIRLASEDGHATYAQLPISEIMDSDPVVVEASTDISAFCNSMLSGRASSLTRGFIITEGGRYLGVGTVLSLLQATSAGARARANELDARLESLNQTHAAAKTLAKDRHKFLSLISHEIRTPMNGVLAVAELLRRQPLGDDAKAYVRTIVDSSETLLRVLQEAVDHTRAEAGELEFRPRPALLRSLMDDLQHAWGPRALEDGVKLLISYDGDPDAGVEIDFERMRQVFDNLIGNALIYARNGVVEARLKADLGSDSVRLSGSVRDNGQKLSQAELEQLFHPFAEGRDSTNSRGLALPISRQIVKCLGGSLNASLNNGRGVTFAFELTAPRAWIEEPTDSNVAELSDLSLQSQPHILIVDDNATNRVVAQALCEMFGCTSECAEDGLEALEAVKSRRFDLVLMDIKMPRMDGVQATQAIRALSGPENIVPIVALTANADPDDAERYIAIGMASVVEKPIKPERLRAAMNAALEAQSEAGAKAAPKSTEQRRTG